MHFTKMHGAGNDYIYVSCFHEPAPDDPSALAVAVSDRHTGIGADGLILIEPSTLADVKMRMYNADGSRAEMCGNGIRCVGKLVYEHGIVPGERLSVETDSGVRGLHLDVRSEVVERVRVEMGAAVLRAEAIPTRLPGDPPIRVPLSAGGREFPVTCVSVGNPHCVVFVEEPTDDWVLEIGPRVETHRAFPSRTNVEFVRVLAPGEIEMRVWERGSGETRACGTGACAAVVAGVLAGMTSRQVLCHLPGGDLTAEWTEAGDVFLTGPAVEVFQGEWPEKQPAPGPVAAY